MRIPTYRAGVAPTSEAPGRSFGARMRAEPFVQQAQAEGRVASEFASQVGQFAITRYKAAREAQINEKILAGEEALREEARRLSKIGTGQLRDVFNEGGKEEEGLWARSTAATREKLLDDVRDLDARRILEDRFNQMELTQRFSLRGTIDSKIEAANAAARTARLQQTQMAGANAETVAEFDLVMQNLGIDSVRLGQLGLGNPDALKKQEYAVVYNAVLGSVRKFANTSDTPQKDLEKIRLALRENDPNLAGDGQLQFGLLKKLPLNAQASILQSIGAGATFIDAPTEEEKKLERVAVEYGKQAGKMVTDFTSRIQQGQTLPDGAMEQLTSVANQAMGAMDINAQQELKTGIEDLQFIQGLAAEIKGVSNVKGINDLILNLEQGDRFGGPGIQEREQLGLDFLRGFKANMEKQLKDDPIGFASTTGSVKIAPIDLSAQAVQATQDSGIDQTGVQQRLSDAIAVRGHYELTGPLKILTPSEVAAYAPSLNAGTAVQKMQAINTVQQLFGDYAPAVLQQLAPNAPVSMHVAGLMRDGLAPEAEVILKGIEEIQANGVPIEGTDMAIAEGSMNTLVGAAYELLPGKLNAELKKNIKDTALAYYAEVLSRRVDKAYDETLWETAVQIATGYNPRTEQGGVQELRGVPTLLPPNRTVDEFQTAMEVIEIQNFAEIATQNNAIDKETFEAIQSDEDYRFQALGKRNGKIVYGVVYGEYGSSDYAIITDPDGNDISFTAEELITASRRPQTKTRGLPRQQGFAPGPAATTTQPPVQEAPQEQAFNLRDYDLNNADATNEAAIAMSNEIIDSFPDPSDITAEDVKAMADQSGFKYDDSVINVGLIMARQKAGKQ